MNQRMIELYKQAQEFAYKNISKESWNTDNFHAVVAGKFAQLIVEECAKRAEVYAYMSPNFNALAEELRSMIGVAQ